MTFNCIVFWFSCLKEIRVALLVMLEDFRKETLWCESRKTDLQTKQNAGIVDWLPRERGDHEIT